MKENVEYLKQLGLTEYQSRAMVVLLSKREATAKEISNLANIPLTKIYQVLNILKYLDLISDTPSKPKLYKSAQPHVIINRLLKKEQKRVKFLQVEKNRQLKLLRELNLVAPDIYEFERVHPALSTAQYDIKSE